jgi:hypothetical protein
LPEDQLARLGVLAARGDVALIESAPDGTMKQVTLFLYVASPPAVVYDVVAHPAEYVHFVPGLSRSTFVERPGVGWVHSWKIDLPVSSFWGEEVYRFEPGPTGAIETRSLDAGNAAYRWEVHPAGPGTLLVMYGYTDVLHSNRFVHAFVRRQATLEHGLALAAQLMLAAPLRTEAERRAAATVPRALARDGGGGGLDALLGRGQVAILHAGEVSLIDRFYAPEPKVLEAIGKPGEYARFVPGVDEAHELSRGPDGVTYTLEMSLPIVSWSTRYVMRLFHHGADGAGVEGDLTGARFRWDLTPRGPAETEVVYRARQPLGRGSLLVRKLLQLNPTLDHGLNVAFALVTLRAMRGRAEGWATK